MTPKQAAAPKAAPTATPVEQPKPVAEQPKAEAQPTPTAATAQPVTTPAAPATKQAETFAKLKVAWAKRGVDLSQMKVTEGKSLTVVVGDGWPTIVIGFGGGVTLNEIRSYQNPFAAAVEGDVLLRKQNERDAKKTTNGATAPTKTLDERIADAEKLVASAQAALDKLRAQKSAAAPAVQPEAQKEETPTAKKARQHKQIEEQQQASA